MTITVYITSFNQRDYLKQAIESVLLQTRQADEIIIVDDASTDGSVELIMSYKTRHPELIKTILNKDNMGIAACRNLALSAAQCDFVTNLDGDDAFMSEKLEYEERLISKTNADVAFSNFLFCENTLDNVVKVWFEEDSKLLEEKAMFTQVISRDFPRRTLFRSELFRRELLASTGGYDADLPIYEDFDFKIRLAKVANFTWTDKPLSLYRLHGEGLSRVGANIHASTLKTIFGKYQMDIEALPDDQRKRVERHITNLLERLQKDPKDNTVGKSGFIARMAKRLFRN